jgi:hypothetical protein
MKYVYDYEKTINRQYWKDFLGRDLTEEEKYLIESIKDEKRINHKIEILNQAASNQGLYIPMLTKMRGNCLFECFQYHNLIDNIMDFRKCLSTLMLLFRDFPNFIPGQSLTLKEIFDCQNEIEFVFCRKTHKLYKYNYDIMCRDIACNYSWTRLPTQLILTIISFIFDLKIRIHYDNGYVTEICTNEDTFDVINIGLLGELHYVPLEIRRGLEREDTIPKYTNALKEFHQWAISMCKSLGRFTIVDDTEEEKKFIEIKTETKSTNFVNFE